MDLPEKWSSRVSSCQKAVPKKPATWSSVCPAWSTSQARFTLYAARFLFASNWSWLTIDIRDNFAISIWEAAGISNIPVIFVGYYIYIYISDSWFETWIYDFPYIGNVIIPTDELIFFTGVGQPPTRLTLIMTDYFLWQAECVNYVDYHCIVSKCSLWL